MNIRLIAPNCNRNTTPIVAYGSAIARIAGGFTASQATGGWIDNHGELIVEPVTVFDCNDRATGTDQEPWFILARRIGRELRQDCVYLAIDGKVTLVIPD